MKFYERIDHTGDIGIRLQAKTLKELFQNAACAMFAEMAIPLESTGKSHDKKFPIQLKGTNAEELLVRWLSELLYLSDSKQVIFTEFKMESLSENTLKAFATGRRRRDFTMTTEIKAVTYHDLKIRKENDLYEVQIIFDV